MYFYCLFGLSQNNFYCLIYLSFFPSFYPLILHCLFKLMHFIAFSDVYNSLTKAHGSLFLVNASISLILMSPSLIC